MMQNVSYNLMVLMILFIIFLNTLQILACAPSNLAVDNLVERLAAAKVRIVRVGHPARATQLTQRYTLDCLMHNRFVESCDFKFGILKRILCVISLNFLVEDIFTVV